MARARDYVADTDAEEAVLSAILVDCSVLETVRDYVAPDDFAFDDHRKIFEGCLHLDQTAGRFDVVSLHGWIRDKGMANRITSQRLGEILNAPAVPLNHAVDHSKRVRSLAQQRRVAGAARQIVAEGEHRLERSVEDFCTAAEAKISAAIEYGNVRDVPEAIGVTAGRVVEEALARGEKSIGAPCGLTELDYRLSGWETGLYVIAGRPGMGKSALAKAICKGTSQRNRTLSVFVSCEMSKEQLCQRLIAAEAKVPLNAIRNGRLSDEHKRLITAAADSLNRIPMVTVERPGATVAEVRAVARRSLREARRTFGSDLKLGCVAVDYIQIMRGNQDGNREGEVASLSRELKRLSGELGCPVLGLSQLNRGVETRQDKRPTMADLRESGAIEQDADAVLLAYRDEYYHENSDAKGLAEIIIGKNRQGASGGKAMLAFIGQYVLFENRNTPDQDGHWYDPEADEFPF